MEALPKHITDEIREILEGCRDGKLNHNQHDFHCGTAHCIAGWKEVLDYQKETGKSLDNGNYELRKWVEQEEGDSSWSYAQEQWGLTTTEADMLFNDFATFEEQFGLLEKLERGERLA